MIVAHDVTVAYEHDYKSLGVKFIPLRGLGEALGRSGTGL